MPVRVAIQGARGSACEMAAEHLLPSANEDESIELVYAVTARAATEALLNQAVALALLVLESPIGTAVPETVDALATLPTCRVVASCSLPVNHVLLGRRPLQPSEVTRILSHPVPLGAIQELRPTVLRGLPRLRSRAKGKVGSCSWMAP